MLTVHSFHGYVAPDSYLKEPTVALSARLACLSQQFIDVEGPSLVPPISEECPLHLQFEASPVLQRDASAAVIREYRQALRTSRAKFMPSVSSVRTPRPHHLPASLLPRDGRSLAADIALAGEGKRRLEALYRVWEHPPPNIFDEKETKSADPGSVEVDGKSHSHFLRPADLRWEVGELIDARDIDGCWTEARIVLVSYEHRAVRVNIWQSKHSVDEWLAMDGLRWAPLHTHSRGSHAVRAYAYQYWYEQPVWAFPLLLQRAAAAGAGDVGLPPEQPSSNGAPTPTTIPRGLGWCAGSVEHVDLENGHVLVLCTQPITVGSNTSIARWALI